MFSTRSGSPVSPETHRASASGLRREWPTLIALPALVAFLIAAAASPLIVMFLGPDFGVSGGREAPWPWALAIIGLLAFWTARLVDASPMSQNAQSALLVVLGITAIVGWWAVEPAWDVGPVLRDPVSLVRSNGHLVLPLLIGLGVWVQGLRMGFQRDSLRPESVREIVRNSIAVLAVSMALAAMIGGNMGGSGISMSLVALPVMFVCSAGAIAAAEMETTRRLAAQRRATAPGWDRWARVSSGSALALLVVIGIGALLLGPGALELVVDAMRTIWNGIATLILWMLYAIVYVVYYVYRVIAWIINSIFGDVHTPIEMPQMEGVPAPVNEPMQEPADDSVDPTLVTVLRWIGLGIVLMIIAAIVFHLSRRRTDESDGEKVDEERTSIFSTDLARNQLRNLFRRKPKLVPPRRLALDRDPGSVRESMLYLQVLASRQETGREPRETPHDFTERLAVEWPGLAGPLETIRDRYEQVRYGETEEDRRAVVEAWRQIWSSRRAAVVGG